jgi:hypothetical protein
VAADWPAVAPVFLAAPLVQAADPLPVAVARLARVAAPLRAAAQLQLAAGQPLRAVGQRPWVAAPIQAEVLSPAQVLALLPRAVRRQHSAEFRR